MPTSHTNAARSFDGCFQIHRMREEVHLLLFRFLSLQLTAEQPNEKQRQPLIHMYTKLEMTNDIQMFGCAFQIAFQTCIALLSLSLQFVFQLFAVITRFFFSSRYFSVSIFPSHFHLAWHSCFNRCSWFFLLLLFHLF